ncbi:recombinase family protein [Bailinhaonella thermotolerans]|uniref:recombinase family protein n=1 Tax=Bailinhaonella thermotolerans TaxID=1070861 RepID=UPI0024139356|nr:recombinase family protein [Bailinhaonella thermotolerans]
MAPRCHQDLPWGWGRLRRRRASFGMGASICDWSDPVGRLFLQALAMVAEFEANIGHQRTRAGMARAKKNGKLKGEQSKLPAPARRSIRRRYAEGEVSLADLATECSVGRSTIHRIIQGPEEPR